MVRRELRQPRWRHKFTNFTFKNSSYVRCAYALSLHFSKFLRLSRGHFTTWNDLFWSCIVDLSAWRQFFSSRFLQTADINLIPGWLARMYFEGLKTSNGRGMISEVKNYIFRWHPRCCFMAKKLGDSKFMLITEVLDNHLRVKIGDNNFGWRFDDSFMHHFQIHKN